MSKRSQETATPKPKAKKSTRQGARGTRRAAAKRPSLLTTAPFAVASDGTLLLNVNDVDAISADELKGRTLFVGTALTKAEKRRAERLLENAGQELRAKIVGALPARRAPKQEPPPGGKEGSPA